MPPIDEWSPFEEDHVVNYEKNLEREARRFLARARPHLLSVFVQPRKNAHPRVMGSKDSVATLDERLAALAVVRRRFPESYARLVADGTVAAIHAEKRRRDLLEKRPGKEDRPRCGARCRTRGGQPCRARVVVDRDEQGKVRIRKRCRMHGGCSTGPKTEEGRRRCAEASRRRWAGTKR
jgi:hypothetical protein